MKKLPVYEIKKFLQNKAIVFSILAVYLALAVIMIIFAKQSSYYNRQLYSSLKEKMSTSGDGNENFNLEHEARLYFISLFVGSFQRIESDDVDAEIFMSSFDFEDISYDEVEEIISTYDYEYIEAKSQVLALLESQTKYINGYKNFIEGMDARITEMQSFEEKGSYNFVYLETAREAYKDCINITVFADEEEGLNALVHDRITVLILFIVPLMFAIGVCGEFFSSSTQIVFTTINGKRKTAVTKLFIVIILSAVSGLGIIVLQHTIYGNILGFGDVSRNIQSVSYFRNLWYPSTIRSFLISSVLSVCFCMVYLSILACSLFLILKNIKIILISYLGYIGISYYAFTAIDDQSYIRALKYINPFYFSYTGERMSAYRDISVFGNPINPSTVELIVLIFFSLMLFFIYFALSGKNREINTSVIRLLKRNSKKGNTNLLVMEIKRILYENFGALALLIMLFACVMNTDTTKHMMANREMMYYEYCTPVEGKISADTEEKISSYRKEYEKMMNRSEHADVTMFRAVLADMQIRDEALLMVESQYEMLADAKEKGADAHIINIYKTDAIFGSTTEMIIIGFVFTVLFITSSAGLFGMDKQTKMENAVKPTLYGRGKCFIFRYIAEGIYCLLGMICFFIPLVLNGVFKYKFSDFDAGIESLIGTRHNFSDVTGKGMNVGGVCLLRTIIIVLSVFCFIELANIITLFVSDVWSAVGTAVIVAIVDFLISYFSISGLEYAVLSGGFNLVRLIEKFGNINIIYFEMIKYLVLLIIFSLLHYRKYCSTDK